MKVASIIQLTPTLILYVSFSFIYFLIYMNLFFVHWIALGYYSFPRHDIRSLSIMIRINFVQSNVQSPS